MTGASPNAWARDVVGRTRTAFEPLADAERAAGARAYMKDVAPFLGIAAPQRRDAQKQAWDALADPTVDDVAAAARALASLPEREYAYAAAELVQRYRRRLPPAFLDDPVEYLLTTVPWWDTVDLWVSAVVSPMCRTHGAATTATIDRWSASPDEWLIRAALGHQRGWRGATDVARVITLCSAHADDGRFFVQKAIGWALRDLTRFDAAAVEGFLRTHPGLTRVAAREAERGLVRARAGRSDDGTDGSG